MDHFFFPPETSGALKGAKKSGHSTAEINGTKEMILILQYILSNSCPLVPDRPTVPGRADLTP